MRGASPGGSGSGPMTSCMLASVLERSKGMVGTGRFELPACRLGGGRSIHLSYVPPWPSL
jgi:hypothetical protein